MDIRELLKQKHDRLTSVPDQLVTAAQLSQRKVLEYIIKELGKFTFTNGKIDITAENMARIQGLMKSVGNALFKDTAYGTALKDYIRQYGRQAQLTDNYFERIIDRFENIELYKTNLELSTSRAVTLLDITAINKEFINPLSQLLQSAVTTGQSMTDAITSLTNYIEGGDVNGQKVDGSLKRYVKQVAYDGFAVADRQYTKIISMDLGLTWYLYQGGELADTRCFCKERHGNYYHINEVKAWGEGIGVGECDYPWQGMMKGTDSSTIFSFCGGYNCKHSLLPVLKSGVPASDIARAKAKGYI